MELSGNMKDGGVYVGEVRGGGIRHGEGHVSYNLPGLHPGQMMSYDGPSKNGKKQTDADHPSGVFRIAGMSTYTGEFKDGEIDGRGTRKWDDGREYTGEWHLGEMHGRGTWTSASGKDVYEGEFDSNRRQGRGTLRFEDPKGGGPCTYQGLFAAHKFHGQGSSFLKEGDFIFEGDFEQGIVQGPGTITWHKRAALAAPFVNGRPHGDKCYYRTLDGSYAYLGAFEDGLPSGGFAAKISASVDTSAVPEPEDAGGKGGKGKKAPPKKSKGDPEYAAELTAGDEMGQIKVVASAFLAKTYNEEGEEEPQPETDWAALEAEQVPLPLELRRLLVARLRPQQEPDEEGVVALGEAVPLWVKRSALGQAVTARARWPPMATRFHGEVGAAPSGDTTMHLEGEGAKEGTHEGLSSLLLPPAGTARIERPHVEMRGSSREMAFVLDFALNPPDIAAAVTKVPETTELVTVPILTLRRAIEGMEGSGALSLSLEVPRAMLPPAPTPVEPSEGDEAPQPQDPPVETQWKGCAWVLSLTSMGSRSVVEEPAPEGDPVEGATAAAATEDDVGTSVEQAGETEVDLGNTTTECARWMEPGMFTSAAWHSIAVSIRRDGLSLCVDGDGRLLSASSGTDGTGAVVAWLPDPSVTPSVPEPAAEGDAGAEAEPESEPEDKGSLVIRVGGGFFSGALSSFCLCTEDDQLNTSQVTSCYSARERDALAPGPAADRGCVESDSVPVEMRGGKGLSESLVVPPSTPAGVYVLELTDGVDASCMLLEGNDEISGAEALTPADLKRVVRAVRPVSVVAQMQINVEALEEG